MLFFDDDAALANTQWVTALQLSVTVRVVRDALSGVEWKGRVAQQGQQSASGSTSPELKLEPNSEPEYVGVAVRERRGPCRWRPIVHMPAGT